MANQPPAAAFKINLPKPTSPVFTATVSAPTNIACIKYWGKASVQYNTPINDSLSLTLDQEDLRAVTTASCSKSFKTDKLWLNGREVVMDPSTEKRFRACVDGIRALAGDKHKTDANGGVEVMVPKADWADMHVHIASYNTFPTAAGLASSAAGFAALVASLVALYEAKETYPGQFSAIARQGSGSACRSLYGGFVKWQAGGKKDDWSDSIAIQVANENHWEEIRAVILVVSDQKKETSSTKGMGDSVATSKLLKYRAEHVVAGRMKEIEQAIQEKDFQTFGKLTMMDSNQFHATCLDTFPPIFYMNDVSKNIVTMVHTYNDWAGEIRAAYTFDAGPNAVLYTLRKHQIELLAIIMKYYPRHYPGIENGYFDNEELRTKALEHKLDEGLMKAMDKRCKVREVGDIKTIYCTKGGPGPRTLDEKCSLFQFAQE